MGGKRTCQTQSISEQSELLRTKRRDNEDAANTAGRPPDRSGGAGGADLLCGLVVSFTASRQRKFLLVGGIR